MEKSGTTARTNMRSRSPLVVIALLILTVFLAYNYWSLTAANGELASELEALRTDLREVSNKHQSAEKQVADLAKQMDEKRQKLVEMEAKVGETEQKQSESTKEIASLKDQLQNAQEALEEAKSEVNGVKQERDSLSGELEKVKKELTDVKNTPKTCDKTDCKEPLREVLTALTKTIGKSPISGALKQNNVDVMAVANDLFEGADAGNAGQAGQQDKQDKPKNDSPGKAPEPKGQGK